MHMSSPFLTVILLVRSDVASISGHEFLPICKTLPETAVKIVSKYYYIKLLDLLCCQYFRAEKIFSLQFMTHIRVSFRQIPSAPSNTIG